MTLPSDSSTTLLVTRDGMGSADPGLQRLLLGKYLSLVLESDRLPATICFYTEGVRLVCEGSPVLDLLAALEARRVRLIVCSTCLDYLNLREAVRAGIVGGMTDIVEAQWRASKVITL